MESEELFKLVEGFGEGKPLAVLNDTELKLEDGIWTGSRIALADTKTTSITGAIPVQIAKKAIEVAIAKRTARRIFPSDNSLVGKPGTTLRFPKFSRVSFGAWTEGGDISETEVTATGIDVQPEWFAGGIKVTYEAIEASAVALVARFGNLLGGDYASYEDLKAYTTLYAGLDANHKEDKTGNGWDDATNGEKYLRDDIVGCMALVEADYFFPSHIVVNTELSQYIRKSEDYRKAMVYGASIHEAKKTELREAGIIGMIYGCEVVTTPNMKSAVDGNTDTFVVVDAEQVGVIVDKMPFTVKQKDFPEKLELWMVGYGAMKFGVLQDDAGAGKTDCVNPI